MPFGVREELLNPIDVQPESNSPVTAESSSTSRSLLNNYDRSTDSDEVLEVTSPPVSQERMGSLTVTELPRYHSLVEDFGRLADRWMASGQLMGPASVGGGYLLNLQIPLSGEEGDTLLGEFAREENNEEEDL